jgi:hypothetical protein
MSFLRTNSCIWKLLKAQLFYEVFADIRSLMVSQKPFAEIPGGTSDLIEITPESVVRRRVKEFLLSTQSFLVCNALFVPF